ncbi:MAG: glycosyltransferase family 2 protein [Prolixibacteraceae bacterium]
MIRKNKPLVSVIIPVYNRESCLSDTLDNLVENKYRPIELILVNDGSKDNTLNVLKQFKENNETDDFRINVLDQPNSGAPAARNNGYRHASGEYIQFLDSDDLVDPDKFNIQIKAMEKEDADFGLCDFKMIYRNDNDKVIYCSNAKGLKKVLKARGTFGCGSPLLKKKLADAISWNVALKRHQDVDYFLKAALMAKKIAYVNQALYLYIHHGMERISDIYATTDPGYRLRMKSLEQLPRYHYNWHYITVALGSLYIALLKYNLKKRLALR